MHTPIETFRPPQTADYTSGRAVSAGARRVETYGFRYSRATHDRFPSEVEATVMMCGASLCYWVQKVALHTVPIRTATTPRRS